MYPEPLYRSGYSVYSGIVMKIITWGILSLLIVACVRFNINEKIISLSISYKMVVLVLIGIMGGIVFQVLDSIFKNFLIKRKYKKLGYYICRSCSGTGWIPKPSKLWFIRRSRKYQLSSRCKSCNGEGYRDWVQNVVGQKEYINVDARPESSP